MGDREELRKGWGGAAAGWAAHADAIASETMPVSAWMIEAVRPQPGDTLLELAAGPGDVGFLAAELIEPGGELISTDWVPEMVDAARRRAEERGISNARFRQEDAQSLTFEAASIDGVLCRFGYMLMPDAGAALRETRRVLRPGRRVALAVWNTPQENPWMSLIHAELIRRGWMDPPQPGMIGPFSWSAEGFVADRLQDAGFVEFEVDTVEIEVPRPSFERWIEVTQEMSRVFREAARQRSEAEMEDLHAALRSAAEPYRQDDGSLAFPGKVWAAWAAA